MNNETLPFISNVTVDAMVPLLVCLIASILAASIVLLDRAGKYPEPFIAIKTWELKVIWIFHILIAFLIIFFYFLRYTDLTILSVTGVILVYPVLYPILLNSKIGSFRTQSGETISIELEPVIKAVENLLLNEVETSIKDKCGDRLVEWKRRDLNDIASQCKNYFISHTDEELSGFELSRWASELLNEVHEDPSQREANSEALFLKVKKVGGQKGVNWVMRNVPRR